MASQPSCSTGTALAHFLRQLFSRAPPRSVLSSEGIRGWFFCLHQQPTFTTVSLYCGDGSGACVRSRLLCVTRDAIKQRELGLNKFSNSRYKFHYRDGRTTHMLVELHRLCDSHDSPQPSPRTLPESVTGQPFSPVPSPPVSFLSDYHHHFTLTMVWQVVR